MGKKSRDRRRKPRSTTLFLDMGKPVALNHITIGKNGSITVGSVNGKEQPIASHIITAYTRDNQGQKIINRLIELPERLTVVPDMLLTHYTWVLAIDTNKPEERLPNIVFTGIVLSKVLPQTDGRLELSIYQEDVIEIHNLNLPSERFGWSFVCKSIINQFPEDLVAVIVDSDLGQIPAINRREEPIQDDFYLPNRFELLYASSDPGDRYIANDLLKLCDRNTREVAKLVASTQTSSLPLLMKADPGEPFTHIRIWKHSAGSSANQDLR